MKTTRAYRTLVQGFTWYAVIVFLLTLCVLYPNNFPALAICMALLGAAMVPLLPVMMENCAEITYPLSEELATGVIFSGT